MHIFVYSLYTIQALQDPTLLTIHIAQKPAAVSRSSRTSYSLKKSHPSTHLQPTTHNPTSRITTPSPSCLQNSPRSHSPQQAASASKSKSRTANGHMSTVQNEARHQEHQEKEIGKWEMLWETRKYCCSSGGMEERKRYLTKG